MYQLIIHHDIGLSKQNQQFTKDDWNLGHVYLELKENDDSVVYGIESGYKDSASQYFEYRPHGKERIELAKEYELHHPEDKILHSKAINIKEIQYLEAMVQQFQIWPIPLMQAVCLVIYMYNKWIICIFTSLFTFFAF